MTIFKKMLNQDGQRLSLAVTFESVEGSTMLVMRSLIGGSPFVTSHQLGKDTSIDEIFLILYVQLEELRGQYNIAFGEARITIPVSYKTQDGVPPLDDLNLEVIN